MYCTIVKLHEFFLLSAVEYISIDFGRTLKSINLQQQRTFLNVVALC